MNFILKNIYHIRNITNLCNTNQLKNTVFPQTVSSLEQFLQQKFSLLSKKLKYLGNYLNWLQFPNSKKSSFCRNDVRKYGSQIILFKIWGSNPLPRNNLGLIFDKEVCTRSENALAEMVSGHCVICFNARHISKYVSKNIFF